MKEKPKALGMGLDALLPVAAKPGEGGDSGVSRGLFSCPIERIVPQKNQPRQHFDGVRMEELMASIRDHGLIEPIVVRKAPGPAERYEIIAGERRWRAAQKAGLHDILVVVKDVSPTEAFELALIENVQREDLNPIEFAEALDRLLHEHDYTHETLAHLLKKDRTTITNALRLLKLPARVRARVMEGQLSEGHARTLLGLGADDEQRMNDVADRVINGRLNVRQTEALVRSVREPAAPPRAQPPSSLNSGADQERRGQEPLHDTGGMEPLAETGGTKSPAVRDVEARLQRRLGARVEVHDRKGKGEIVIAYNDLDELDRILAIVDA